MAKQRKRLGEILYKAGLVEKQALIDAIKTSKTNNKRLGQILLELGLIDEDALTKAIAKQFELQYIDLDNTTIPEDATKLIPQELMKRHNVLPLGMDNGKLKVIISDPLDLEMIDAIRFRLNTELECCVANPTKIRSYIQDSFDQTQKEESDRLRHSIDATAAELAEVGDALQAETLRAQAAGGDDDAPIIRLVNLIIDNAYDMRASDIHIEPMADRVRVRYRVDGVCPELPIGPALDQRRGRDDPALADPQHERVDIGRAVSLSVRCNDKVVHPVPHPFGRPDAARRTTSTDY